MTKARTNADNVAGDISAVTAGTGLTGGGTSGAITLTNDMATTIAAKGDILVGTANDTYDRLAVASTSGYLLSVDSAETTGLKWAAPAGASFVGASAARDASFSVSASTATAIAFNTADQFDTDAIHDTATNNTRFTIPSGKGGKWLCNISPMISGGTPGGGVRTVIFVNGSPKRRGSLGYISGNGETEFPLTEVLNVSAGDYIEFYVWQNFQTTATFYCATSPTGEKQGTAQVVYLGA